MINFEKTYKDKPFVIINIDKEHDGLYKNFSTEYICQTLDEAKAEARENGLSNIEIANATPRYKGVKIEFNYLKSYKEYPEINIIIIGDEK